jgi:hypothetical protein
MATNKKTFFQCFSINFHRFLKANGLYSMSKGIHQNGKTFWVYERTENFEKLLKIWHDTKPVAANSTTNTKEKIV